MGRAESSRAESTESDPENPGGKASRTACLHSRPGAEVAQAATAGTWNRWVVVVVVAGQQTGSDRQSSNGGAPLLLAAHPGLGTEADPHPWLPTKPFPFGCIASRLVSTLLCPSPCRSGEVMLPAVAGCGLGPNGWGRHFRLAGLTGQRHVKPACSLPGPNLFSASSRTWSGRGRREERLTRLSSNVTSTQLHPTYLHYEVVPLLILPSSPSSPSPTLPPHPPLIPPSPPPSQALTLPSRLHLQDAPTGQHPPLNTGLAHPHRLPLHPHRRPPLP